MRAAAALVLLVLGCGPVRDELPAITVAVFQSDATVPLGHPLAGKPPAMIIEEPLLLKGIVLRQVDTVVICAIDWCTMSTDTYTHFRQTLAAAAGTSPDRVTIHCTHTHSGPVGGSTRDEVVQEVADRAARALRDALPRARRVTHVGTGAAEVQEFASNRRVPGPGGTIKVRYSSTKDAALRAEPIGLIDPKLRTVTLLAGATPLVRMHYYASHPQSFYGDGRVHPDTPGWARSRLEKEEGIPHLYFTGGAGNVTAGKFNDGSPEARASLVDHLADGMRRSIAATRIDPVGRVTWTTVPVRLAKRDGSGDLPVIDLIRLTLGEAEIIHLPGEPFVEYQLFATAARPDRFVAFAGYGDGGTGYICLDTTEGGYEPTASRVAEPTEVSLKSGITRLLQDRKIRVIIFGGHPDDPESAAGGLVAMLTKAGHDVICAYGTTFRGDRTLGGEPEATVRQREATAACKILGASTKFFPYAHEKFFADAETVKAVSGWLAEVKPDVVVTHWPMDTHENHHTVSSLVWQAYAHKGGWSLYYFEVMTGQQTLGFKPDLYLDLAGVWEIKKAALDCHVSQHPEKIWEFHDGMHRNRGSECGVARAEAYTLVEAKEGCAVLPVSFLHRKAP
jgi:LmbE family N-acetylglucosaminyl deacetylase